MITFGNEVVAGQQEAIQAREGEYDFDDVCPECPGCETSRHTVYSGAELDGSEWYCLQCRRSWVGEW